MIVTLLSNRWTRTNEHKNIQDLIIFGKVILHHIQVYGAACHAILILVFISFVDNLVEMHSDFYCTICFFIQHTFKMKIEKYNPYVSSIKCNFFDTVNVCYFSDAFFLWDWIMIWDSKSCFIAHQGLNNSMQCKETENTLFIHTYLLTPSFKMQKFYKKCFFNDYSEETWYQINIHFWRSMDYIVLRTKQICLFPCYCGNIFYLGTLACNGNLQQIFLSGIK